MPSASIECLVWLKTVFDMPGTNIHIATPLRIPPYILNHPVPIADAKKNKVGQNNGIERNESCWSVSMRWEDESAWWQLPFEPVVSINGRNEIVKRNVMKVASSDIKRRGSVKELWCQADYQITISGFLIGEDWEDYVETQIRKLKAYCEGRKSILVSSLIFTAYDITKISIESYDFPFTAGSENQRYTIKAVSDDFDKNKLLIAK